VASETGTLGKTQGVNPPGEPFRTRHDNAVDPADHGTVIPCPIAHFRACFA
jgi:hypothetical protein